MKTKHGDPIAFRPDAESEDVLAELRKKLPLKPSDFARLAARYVWPRLLSGEISMMELGQTDAVGGEAGVAKAISGKGVA